MKISGISNYNIVSHFATSSSEQTQCAHFLNFRGKIIQFPNNSENNKQDTIQSITDPDYYQSIKGIKKPEIKTTVTLSSGEKSELEISNYTLQELLSSKKGKPDKKLVKKFISLYTYSLELEKERNKQEQDILEQSIDEEHPNVTAFESSYKDLEEVIRNELFNPDCTSSFEFAHNVIMQLSGENKNLLVKALLLATEEQEKLLDKKAYVRTEKLFNLSKTNSGYDFTGIEEKNSFIDLLDDVILNYAKENNEDEYFQDFIDSCRNEEGKIDFSLANAAIKMIKSIPVIYTPHYVINNIKKYTSGDFENRYRIFEAMINLNETDFMMDESDTDYEDLLDLCFDKDGSYSQDRTDTLFNAIATVTEWIDTQMSHTNFNSDRYEACHKMSKELIIDYFSEITDDKGNFSTDNLDFSKYLDYRIGNIYVL